MALLFPPGRCKVKKGLSAALTAATDLFTVILLGDDQSATHIKLYSFLSGFNL